MVDGSVGSEVCSHVCWARRVGIQPRLTISPSQLYSFTAALRFHQPVKAKSAAQIYTCDEGRGEDCLLESALEQALEGSLEMAARDGVYTSGE